VQSEESVEIEEARIPAKGRIEDVSEKGGVSSAQKFTSYFARSASFGDLGSREAMLSDLP
jgi:hypothetical protein